MKQLWLVAALSAGLHGQSPTEIFRLRSECGAIARQWQQDEEKHWPQGESGGIKTEGHYDPYSNRCYVKSTMIDFPLDGMSLYDGQTQELLASVGRLNDTHPVTEWGHIGAEEVKYGQANYERVKAFMDDQMRDNP
jgi:hypothetical protein